MLAQLTKHLADFIYPPLCIVCKSPRENDSRDFCRTCTQSLSTLAATIACHQCAAPIPDGSACPYCNGHGIFPFDKIVALGPFREPLRKMVHEIKYHHRWPLVEALADQMLNLPRVRDLLDSADVLVPMPLHWSRHIGRGYNQAHSLAHRLAKYRKHLKVTNPIIRLKNTPAQTMVRSRADRAANLRFAFAAMRPREIVGRRIILIDDVLTTAATLKSAARTLKESAPASLSALVLAVADPRRRDFQSI